MEELNIKSGADLPWQEYCRINEFVATSFGGTPPPMPEENAENLAWQRHKYRYYHFTEIDGKIASGLWSYLIPFLVNGRRTDVWSVGGVSTAPEFRGRALMSRMVTKAMNGIRQSGAPLVWLAGKRYRYGRFGFQRAGNMLELDIEKDNISLFCHDSGCEVTFFDDPARVPWQEVKRLTAEQTFRHDVPLNDYAFKCIDHKFLAVFAGRNGKFEAAAVYRPSEHPVLAEYGGNIDALSDILIAFAEKYPAFQVRMPQIDNEFFRLFFPLAERWRVDINYGLAIADLKKCLELITVPALPELEGKAVNLVMTEGMFDEQRASVSVCDGSLVIGGEVEGAPTVQLDQMTMVSCLFGPVRPSMFLHEPAVRWLDSVLPITMNLQTSVHGA